jgi:beta-lactamase regulating signal transducer with metallopeptidase domain
MECTYSTPKNSEGNTPSSNIEAFGFTKSSCTTATPSASASPSATQYVDIASSSAVAKGVYDITFVIWIIGVIVAIYVGFKLGSWMYRR